MAEKKLTKRQIKANEEFNILDTKLQEQGYRPESRTVSILKANIYALFTAGPVALLAFVLYALTYSARENTFVFDAKNYLLNMLLLIVALIGLTVLHELSHGFFWGLFTKNKWKDVEFGIMWEMLTPYCHCKEPLLLWQMILGAFMPLITVGILPWSIAMFTGNHFLMLISCFMMLGSGGDLTIILMVIKEKKNMLVVDHPSECGCILYHKE